MKRLALLLSLLQVVAPLAYGDVAIPTGTAPVLRHQDHRGNDLYRVRKLYLRDADTNTMGFSAPTNLTGDSYDFVLPGADGSANQCLATDGAEALSWIDVVRPTATQTLTNKTLTSPDIGTSARVLAQAPVRFYDSDSSHYVGLKAPATTTANLDWTLPSADGSSGQVMKTDGAGALGWVSPLTNPMTTTGDIIYSSDNSGTAARLAPNGTATKKILTQVSGGAPAWNQIDATGYFASGALATTTAGERGVVDPYSTNGVVYAGTYTPTFTLTNGSGGTARQHNYIRVGKVVHVTGAISGMTVTTTGTDFEIVLTSLPVATGNFADQYDATGVGKLGRGSGGKNEPMFVTANSGAQTISLHVEETTIATGGTAVYASYSFSYEIQ